MYNNVQVRTTTYKLLAIWAIREFLVLFCFSGRFTFASSTGEKDVVFRETEIIINLLIFKKQLLCQNLKTQ